MTKKEETKSAPTPLQVTPGAHAVNQFNKTPTFEKKIADIIEKTEKEMEANDLLDIAARKGLSPEAYALLQTAKMLDKATGMGLGESTRKDAIGDTPVKPTSTPVHELIAMAAAAAPYRFSIFTKRCPQCNYRGSFEITYPGTNLHVICLKCRLSAEIPTPKNREEDESRLFETLKVKAFRIASTPDAKRKLGRELESAPSFKDAMGVASKIASLARTVDPPVGSPLRVHFCDGTSRKALITARPGTGKAEVAWNGKAYSATYKPLVQCWEV